MALPWLKVHEITTMSAGKGDSPRRVDTKRYNENYERIFRKTTIEQEAKPEAEIRLRVGEETEPAPRQED
jgi:hypothetical protein